MGIRWSRDYHDINIRIFLNLSQFCTGIYFRKSLARNSQPFLITITHKRIL